MTSNVPKFASFRPKPKEISEPAKSQDEPERNESSKLREKSEKHKISARRDKTDRSERSSKDDSSRSAHDKRSHGSGKVQPKLYFIDRKGDPANLTYGSLYRFDVPPYRRYGYGNILGLDTDVKIDRDLSTDKAIVTSGPRSQRRERLLTSKRSKEIDGKLRLVKTETTSEIEKEADFIPVTKKRKREPGLDAPEDTYHDIEGGNVDEMRFDSDIESESGTDSNETNEVTQKNSTLIQTTRSDPHNLQAWLELANHQEAMMRLGRASELSDLDRRHLAEVRVSTYEEAIQKIGDNQNSQIKLHLGLMAEATRAWNETKLQKIWLEILATFPQSAELWLQYLDFVQGGFSGFKYEQCRVTFHRSLKALSTARLPLETVLHILVRLTCLIRGTGYQELAVAIWQALLEFHLMRPEITTDALALFEEFWDSEVARIGEVDAKGWRSFTPENPSNSTPATISLKTRNMSISVFEDFRVRELEHIEKLRYPGRTTDETGDEDPFHLILFSDIEEYLRVLPHDTPPNLIVEAYLCFAGMPRLPQLNSGQRSWYSDPFLQFHHLSHIEEHGITSQFSKTLQKFMDCPGQYQRTIELLFDHGFPKSTDGMDLNFTRLVLKLLAVSLAGGEEFGEYLLAYELAYFPAEAFKTAKQLLKARPTNLRLYNAYGLVESRRGNSVKADQVFSAALAMQKDVGTFATLGSLQLFNSWVWEALHRVDKTVALWRLVSPQGIIQTSNQSVGPEQASILRARTNLIETKERALLGRDYPSAVLSTSLVALLAYLPTDHGKPEVALAAFETLSDWLVKQGLSHSPAAELHAQSIAQFLSYHATSAPIVKPALLRNVLEPLIAQFNHNTILLSLYATNEARFSIDDRVRGLIQHNDLGTSKSTSITDWFFAIHYEMVRGEIAGSTSHSVRALFRKAEDDVGAYCPALWRSHVLYELGEARKEREKRPPKKSRRDEKKKAKEETRLEESYRRLKETFFRGMTHLPWCKDYMMLAFTHLKDEVLAEEELAKLHNVMVEKELRIYVDIDVGS